MARRRRVASVRPDQSFKGRQFTAEVILWAVHWYLMFPHRRVKRLVRPGLGFGSFHKARRTLAGYEAMAMMRKGQVRGVGGRDMRTQASFVAELFQVAA
jgi:transposase-like protein